MKLDHVRLLLTALALLSSVGCTVDHEGDDAGECADDADNDRDGLFDCDDPDCAGAGACTGDGDDDDDLFNPDDDDATPPNDDDAATVGSLSLTPNPLDFGTVIAGQSAVATLTATNEGSAAIEITDLVLPAVGNFELLTTPVSATLPAGSTMTWDIRYSPLRFEGIEATLLVHSDDPEAPQVAVTLLAAGSAPMVSLDPPSFDFGNVELGCSASLNITISNVGDLPLTLADVEFEDLSSAGELSASALPDVGEVLDPGESKTVAVDYVPVDVEFDSGVLHVRSNDPATPDATANQFGVASYGEGVLDDFIQEGNNATDILFVVDNSCSMSEEQSALGANFASFLQIIDSLDMDFHLGVVSTDIGDSGQLQGTTPLITPNTPDPEGTFSTNVNLGISGSGIAQGLHNAYLALSPPNIDPSGPNFGFMRDSAGLRIVFVGDQAEQSVDVIGWSTTSYVEWFRSLKPNPNHVVLSDISGGTAGCTSSDGSAAANPDYVLASLISGGLSASICDPDWISTLQDLAWLSQHLNDTFPLSAPAVPETIAVSLNGVPVFVGWTFDPVLGAVVFDLSHIPENGDTVDIEYTGLGVGCE